uniref:Uncharacterized protein n=2 Tax=Proboscia inermis TaxID=420281 RepID=A0A7S0G9R2_9STRA|mmetsp:Transcript_15988/g.16168  ORF Transcript_15988/g.16168 Transcript_15988/m.16168 type:complete len:535 (+) Transcript_15988:25-1629(+)
MTTIKRNFFSSVRLVYIAWWSKESTAFQNPFISKQINHRALSTTIKPQQGLIPSTQLFPRELCFTPNSRIFTSAVYLSSSPQTQIGGAIQTINDVSTTAELLASVWDLIRSTSDMERGEERTILYPSMSSKLTDASWVSRFMNHLDTCKDVCEVFGISNVLIPYTGFPLGGPFRPLLGFTVKSYANRGADQEEDFEYDPLWDDSDDYWGDLDLGFDDDEDEINSEAALPDIVGEAVPANDDEMIQVTRRWVDKMMSDMGICPFTSGPDMSGMPMGKVYYCVDRSSKVEDLYASYWKEVVRVEQSTEKELSTTLMITPEFALNNAEMFECFSGTLTQPLQSLDVEDLLQLVFFHPQWSFRDGGDRVGDANAANYARRSVWPMINILRTKQVRMAQRGIPTGLVYQQNERTLSEIGSHKLESMLRKRDWQDIADVKINRGDHEALRVAKDFQQTGKFDEKDLSFEFDATPAVNKVDRSQIDGGDMVNVVFDALERRLKKGKLTGVETSATMMAADFLLKELDSIAKSPPPACPFSH